MLEALPMSGFIPGNITQGPCGVSVSSGGMSFERLTQKDQEMAFRAQALDLATGKSEHMDLDPIGIYKLKIGTGTYRHRVTNEIVMEQTLLSPDFGSEPIGVWTSAGDTGQGTKEEYERVVNRARTFAQADGEAAMFWISPGNSGGGPSAKPEHRAYLWKKDKNNEVTAYSYQLGGSRDSISRMMVKMGYGNGEKQIEDQVIFTLGTSSLNNAKVFNAYADSLTPTEKAGQNSYLEKFRQEKDIPDSQRLEKLESAQKKFENELKAVYEGDIRSSLKSVLHGMLSLAVNEKTDHSEKSATGVNSTNNVHLVDGVTLGQDKSVKPQDRPERLPESKRRDMTEMKKLPLSSRHLRPVEEGISDREKNRELAQDKILRLELVRKILLHTSPRKEAAGSGIIAPFPDGLKETEIGLSSGQTQSKAAGLLRGEKSFPHQVDQAVPLSQEKAAQKGRDIGHLLNGRRKTDLEERHEETVMGNDRLFMMISREIRLLKAQQSDPLGKMSVQMTLTRSGRLMTPNGAGERSQNGNSRSYQAVKSFEEADAVIQPDKIKAAVNKVTASLFLIQKMMEMRSSDKKGNAGTDHETIPEADSFAVYSIFKETAGQGTERKETGSERQFFLSTEQFLSNPDYLIKMYEMPGVTEVRSLIAALMRNWLINYHRENNSASSLKADHASHKDGKYLLKLLSSGNQVDKLPVLSGPPGLREGTLPIKSGIFPSFRPFFAPDKFSREKVLQVNDLNRGQIPSGGLKRDVPKKGIRGVLNWLTESVHNGRNYLLPEENEIVGEIILLLRLLVDDWEVLQIYSFNKNKLTDLGNYVGETDWEMKPVMSGYHPFPFIPFKAKPKKAKRKGVIYQYCVPFFVACNNEVKYDKI